VVVIFDKDRVKLDLDAHVTLEQLQKLSAECELKINSAWNPEYGRFMLEGTPKDPYGCTMNDFLTVEDNMRQR
jgi:glutamate--cysteine ligase catalytic subunit